MFFQYCSQFSIDANTAVACACVGLVVHRDACDGRWTHTRQTHAPVVCGTCGQSFSLEHSGGPE